MATDRQIRVPGHRPMMLVAMLTALLATMFWTVPAGAHAGDQSYLYLDVTETELGGRVEVPIVDLREVLGISLEGTDEEVVASAAENAPAISAYFSEHIQLSRPADGTRWPLTFETGTLIFADPAEQDDNYIIFAFEAAVTDGTIPRELDIMFDPFFEITGRDGLLLIANDWEGGVIDNGHEVFAAFDSGSRTQTIDLGDTGWWKNFRASIKLGVNHIKTGPDHILFVMVLVLPAVLIFSDRWRPTRTFGSSLWRVLKIVSMFTLAHSITFTLAGLGILPLPPSRFVETVIAGSIAAAALHNLRPIAPNKEWLISFAFGLFHGMGFASLVEGLDVDRSTQLISLLGRNVGIEIGQAAVVLVSFPALFLLRRTAAYRPFFTVASLGLAGVSLGWMIERIFDKDLRVADLVDPLVQWPRAIVYVALLTVVAAGLFISARAKDRLLPVHDDDLGVTGTTSGPDEREPISV